MIYALRQQVSRRRVRFGLDERGLNSRRADDLPCPIRHRLALGPHERVRHSNGTGGGTVVREEQLADVHVLLRCEAEDKFTQAPKVLVFFAPNKI